MIPATCATCGVIFDIRAKCRIGTAKHCSRACRHGATFEERFWRKVTVLGPDDCWLWHGSVTIAGYGQINRGGTLAVAPRVAYEFAYGSIPDGKYVCHSCDNPPCVNPRHLWAGTPSENILDAYAKGRHERILTGGAPGERHPAHKLTSAAVLDIRTAVTRGVTQTSLARKYGVYPSVISRVVSRKVWRHVP